MIFVRKTKELHDEGFTGFILFFVHYRNGDEIFCFDKDNNIVLLTAIQQEKLKSWLKGFFQIV